MPQLPVLNPVVNLALRLEHSFRTFENFMTTSPFDHVILLAVTLALYCFVTGAVTQNYSAVDRQWSLAPVAYAILFAIRSAGADTRVLVMAALVTVWGLRLTYNFWRKGGYNGEEDYRWPVLRKKINNRFLFEIFNLTFISAYQHFLILMFSLPVGAAWWRAAEGTAQPWNNMDLAAAAWCVFALVFETVGDEQQWAFQEAKHGRRPRVAALKEDYDRGFLTRGLFRYTRHPNFFGEQSFWVGLYFFTVASGDEWLNWSATGAILLLLLFQGSTGFTEDITAAKYSQYADYQRITSRLLPLPPSGDMPSPKVD